MSSSLFAVATSTIEETTTEMHTHSFAVTSDRRKSKGISIGQYVRTRYASPRRYAGPIGAVFEELYWAFRQVSFWLRYDWQTQELEDIDVQAAPRKPESIDSLCLTTKFNRSELKILYRTFKHEFPTGAITLQRFKEIYAKEFCNEGASISKYPEIMFNAFDSDGDGQIGFGGGSMVDLYLQELVTGLSPLCRGSLEEKLEWVFHLYDFDKNGNITQDDLHAVVSSIFDLLGRGVWPPFHCQTITHRVIEMQQKFDLDQDGMIGKEEFIQACAQDPIIRDSMLGFERI